MGNEMYVRNDTAEIRRLPDDLHPVMRAVRVYRCMPSTALLQIRAPSVSGQAQGKRSYSAQAWLNLGEAVQLRHALDQIIEEMSA